MTTEETTTLARTFIDDLDQLPAEIPGAANLEPGRLAWLHGTNAAGAKMPGCFYGRDTAFVEVPAAPWVLDDRYTDQGEVGYSAPQLNIALIGWREQWFKPGQDRGDLPTWLTTYEDGAKKLIEYLILVDGLIEPMVLSVSGKYKAGPFAQIISGFKRGALAQAMRRVKRTLPPWSFWLPIAGQRDRDGRPVYVKAQDGDGKEYGSIVTPPTLIGMPIARSVQDIINDAEVWQSYQDWLKYKRLPQNAIEASYTVTSTPALPPGRNVPVPVSDGEIDEPF